MFIADEADVGYKYENDSSLVYVVIPDGLTSIGDGAFSGCENLISIEIPNSLTTIGERAFSDCI